MEETTSRNPGGYDYQFVDAVPNMLICNICYLPSRDPYLSVCCGHLFCNSCLNNAVTTIKVCPMCRSEEFNTFSNKQADREVKNLNVLCPNKKKGCDWVGELRAVTEHIGSVEGCKYVSVPCRNGCGKKIQRRNLAHHVLVSCPRREEECKHCSTVGGYQFITGRHKKLCPKLPLPCPNKCQSDKINREDIAAHRKICPLEMVWCKHGCNVQIARKDQESHDEEKMQDHLAMTKTELMATKQRVNVLEALLFKHISKKQPDGSHTITAIDTQWSIQLHLASLTASTNPIVPVVIKMKEYSRAKLQNKTLHSDIMYTGNRGYSLCFSVIPSGKYEGSNTHLSAYLYLMKGPYDDQLAWPFTGKVNISLLNQMADEEHVSKTWTYTGRYAEKYGSRVTDGKYGKGLMESLFVSNECLSKSTSACQYLKDDCLYFKVDYSATEQ